MDINRIVESAFRYQHRHDNGEWVDLEERPSHHDPSDHDPERGWGGKILACPRCDDLFRVVREAGRQRE